MIAARVTCHTALHSQVAYINSQSPALRIHKILSVLSNTDGRMDSITSNGSRPPTSLRRTSRVSTARRQGIFWICTAPISLPSMASFLEGGSKQLPLSVSWIKGQQERGATTGFDHFQFVCAFSEKKSLAAVVGVFGRGIHAEISRSSAANDYCWKEETRVGEPFEVGGIIKNDY